MENKRRVMGIVDGNDKRKKRASIPVKKRQERLEVLHRRDWDVVDKVEEVTTKMQANYLKMMDLPLHESTYVALVTIKDDGVYVSDTIGLWSQYKEKGLDVDQLYSDINGYVMGVLNAKDKGFRWDNELNARPAGDYGEMATNTYGDWDIYIYDWEMDVVYGYYIGSPIV